MNQSRPYRPLLPAFAACAVSTAVLGFFHWRIPYSQLDLLALALPWGISCVVLAALFSHRTLQNALLRGAGVVLGGSLAVVLRVIADCIADPTSHNLWPFELILASFLTIPTAAAGTVLGWLIRRRKSDAA